MLGLLGFGEDKGPLTLAGDSPGSSPPSGLSFPLPFASIEAPIKDGLAGHFRGDPTGLLVNAFRALPWSVVHAFVGKRHFRKRR